LRKWKAAHDYVGLRRAEELDHAMAIRESAQVAVHQSPAKWVTVARRAEKDAKQWHVARSSSPTPQPASPEPQGPDDAQLSPLPGSIWAEPSAELLAEARNAASCIAFWERVKHFLSLVQSPQSEDGVVFLEHLRQLLVTQKTVDPFTLLRWLHLCGSRLTNQREYFRLVSFVCVLLNVPLGLLVKWSRLPVVRSRGFDISVD
jgi:hypothetical protein